MYTESRATSADSAGSCSFIEAVCGGEAKDKGMTVSQILAHLREEDSLQHRHQPLNTVSLHCNGGVFIEACCTGYVLTIHVWTRNLVHRPLLIIQSCTWKNRRPTLDKTTQMCIILTSQLEWVGFKACITCSCPHSPSALVVR